MEQSTAPPSIWLVDGFNVLHASLLAGRDRSRWWTAPRRAELLARVERFAAPHAEVWVVFDARSPVEPADGDPAGGRLRQVFAHSADEWLLARLREERDPARVAVVTADRKLAARARHRGARVVAPGEFLARCGS